MIQEVPSEMAAPEYVYSKALKPLEWRYSTPDPRRALYVPTILREWHRAALVGLSLDRLSIDGKPLKEIQLERLNYFIQGRGAWRCTNLGYWDAMKMLRKACGQELDIRYGPTSGGRHSKETIKYAVIPKSPG